MDPSPMDQAPMDQDRAAEIIAAYGSDAARWPDAERAAAVHLIAGDPALSAARREAAELDALLVAWAATPVARGNPDFMAATAARRVPAFALWRWAAGGSMAAALTVGIVLVNPAPAPVHHQAAAVATVSDEQAFALLFTPTPDEENII